MKKILVALTAVIAVGIAVPVALSANTTANPNASDYNGTAPLVHVGLNPSACTAPFSNTGTTPTDSGVVNRVTGPRFLVQWL